MSDAYPEGGIPLEAIPSSPEAGANDASAYPEGGIPLAFTPTKTEEVPLTLASQGEKDAALRTVLKTVVGKEPTLDAEVNKIADTLKTSKKVVFDNLPKFRALADEKDYDPATLRVSDPVLYGVLFDHPELAAQVKGAVTEDLSSFKKILRGAGANQQINENLAQSQGYPGLSYMATQQYSDAFTEALTGKPAPKPIAPADRPEAYTPEEAAAIKAASQQPREITNPTIDPLANEPGSIGRTVRVLGARIVDDYRNAKSADARANVAYAVLGGSSPEVVQQLESQAYEAKLDASGNRYYGKEPLASFSDALQGVQSSVSTLIAGGVASVATLGAAATATALGAPGAGAKIAAFAPLAAKLNGARVSFRQELGGYLLEADDIRTDDGKAIDEPTKIATGVLYASIAAVIETANELGEGSAAVEAMGPLGQIVSGGAGKRNFMHVALASPSIRLLLKQALGEGVEEGSQQTAQEVIEYMAKSITDGKLNSPDIVGSMESIGSSAAGGFNAGLLLGVGGQVGGAASSAVVKLAQGVNKEQSKITDSIESEPKLEAIRKMGATETGRNSPELIAQIVAGESAQSGHAIVAAHVDPAAIVAHFAEKGEDPVAAIAALDGPEAAARFRDAAVTGAKYEVPAASYASKWTESGLADAVKDDTATRADLYTPNELALEQVNIEDRVAAILKREETSAGIEQTDTMRQQLEHTGQSQSDAETVALMHQALAETVAERTGADVSEMFKLEQRGVAPAVMPLMRTEFGSFDVTGKNRAGYTDLATGLLNARGDAARARDPKRPFRARFSAPALKVQNDVFGHEAGDSTLRTMAGVLTATIPDGAQRGGDIEADVASPKQAEEIAAAMSKALDPTGRLQVVASVAARTKSYEETAAALGDTHKKTKANAVAAGKIGDRGQLPPGFANNEALKPVLEPLSKAKPAELVMTPEIAAAQAAEGLGAAEGAYLDESGLLNGRGLDGAIRFKQEGDKVLSGDIRSFKKINDVFGREQTDAILADFYRLMAEHGGGAINAAHPSGDEIGAVAPEAKMRRFFEAFNRVAGKTAYYTVREDGSTAVQAGLTFAIGVGETKDEADRQRLPESKRQQDAAGEVVEPVIYPDDGSAHGALEALRAGGYELVRTQGLAESQAQGRAGEVRRRGGIEGVGTRDGSQSRRGTVRYGGMEGRRGADVPGAGAGAQGRNADRGGISGASDQSGASGGVAGQDAGLQPSVEERLAAARAENARLKAGLRDTSSETSKAEATKVAQKLVGSKFGATAKSMRDAFETVMDPVGGYDSSPTEIADSRTRQWLDREPSAGSRSTQKENRQRRQEWLAAKPEPHPDARTVDALNEHVRNELSDKERAAFKGVTGVYEAFRMILKGDLRWDGPNMAKAIAMLQDIPGLERASLPEEMLHRQAVEQYDRDAADFYGVADTSFDPSVLEKQTLEQPRKAAKAKPADKTKSPEFKSWFGGSKVVDEKGKPRRVFHGSSDGGFDTFDPQRQDKNALYGPGFYFTEDPAIASSYVEKGQGDAPSVYPVYVKIENPFRADGTAAELLPVLKKFKAKPVPAELKRMLDAAVREDTAISSPAEFSLWAENTEWAYNILQKLGKTGEELAQTHFDYFVERAVRQIEKEVRGGHIPKGAGFGEEALRYIERNVFREFGSGGENIQEVLRQIGFDGITHIGGDRMGGGETLHRVWIAFDPTQIKSAIGNEGAFDPADPNILHQPGDAPAGGKAKSTPRGSIEITRDGVQRAFKILVTQYQNNSTRLHELGHAYLELLGDMATGSLVPDQRAVADWQAALKYLGAEDRKSITVEQKEKWAGSFEAYLMEGKAPSTKLAGTFQRMRLWLLDVYKHVKNLGVELDDEIRGVFDRLLATDEEIKSMRATMGMQGSNYSTAADEASARVYREVVEEQKRVTSGAWKEELRKGSVIATAEYDARPAAQAKRYMLDQKQRWSASTENLDTYAEMFGYRSGDAMLEAMKTLPERDAAIRERSDQIARSASPEIHGEKERLENLTVDALHSEGTVDALIKEWGILMRRAAARGVPDRKALQIAAESTVARMPVRRMSSVATLERERTMAERSVQAAANGDFKGAAEFKSKQILAHMQWRAIDTARRERERFDELTTKLAQRKQKERLGNAGPAYRDVVQSVLESLGVVEATTPQKPRQTPDALKTLMEDNGQGVVFDPAWLADLIAKPRTWRDFTVEEMRAVDTALRNIKKGATQRNTFLMDGKRFDREEFITKSAEDAAKYMPDLGPKIGEAAMNLIDKGLSLGATGDAWILTSPTMIEWLGGEKTDSIWHRAIVAPLRDAAAYEADLLKKHAQPIIEAMEAIPAEARKRWGEKIDGKELFPGHREDIVPSRRFEVLMMLFNRGTKSSIERLTEGRGITLEQVDNAIVKLGITKAELGWVQSVWDASEAVWPLARDLEERDTGVVPDKLDLEPFIVQTSEGPVAMKGGYFPAIYDRDITRAGGKQSLDVIAGLLPVATRPSTSRGYLKGRVEGFTDAIDLNPRSIQAGLTRSIHDIAFREPLKSVAGLLMDDTVQDTLRRHLGVERRAVLKQWLHDIGRLDAATADPHAPLQARIAQTMKTNLGMSVLGYAVDNFIGDPVAMLAAPIVTDLKARHLMGGLVDLAASPMKLREFAMESSAQVRLRDGKIHAEYAAAATSLGKQQHVAARSWRWFRDHAFYVAELMDAFTTTAIWTGAYRQAANEGSEHSKAVEFADKVMVQSVPASSVVDKSALQRSRGIFGALNMFYGYYNLVYQQERRIAHQIHTAEGAAATTKATLKALAQHLALVVVTRHLAGLIIGKGPEPEDGQDPAHRWLSWFLRGLGVGSIDSLPFGLGREVETKLLNRQSGSRPLPMNAFADAVEKAVKKAFDAADEDKSTTWIEAAVAALKAAGMGTGTPLRPLRPFDYLLKAEDENSNVKPRGPGDVIGGMLYSGGNEKPAANIPTLIQDAVSGQQDR